MTTTARYGRFTSILLALSLIVLLVTTLVREYEPSNTYSNIVEIVTTQAVDTLKANGKTDIKLFEVEFVLPDTIGFPVSDFSTESIEATAEGISGSVGTYKTSVAKVKMAGDSISYTYYTNEWVTGDVDMLYVYKDVLPVDIAYECLMKSNIAYPKTKFIVLRIPVGPHDVNPQYIFGHINPVFVDAINCSVTDKL